MISSGGGDGPGTGSRGHGRRGERRSLPHDPPPQTEQRQEQLRPDPAEGSKLKHKIPSSPETGSSVTTATRGEQHPRKRADRSPAKPRHRSLDKGASPAPGSPAPGTIRSPTLTIHRSTSESAVVGRTDNPATASSAHPSPDIISQASQAVAMTEHRRILPASRQGTNETQPSAETSARETRRRTYGGRVQVSAACLACRTRKVKCNGARPTCIRCVEQNNICVYDSDVNSTRMITLRRRLAHFEFDTHVFRELVSFLQSRPEREAHDILQRLRCISISAGNSLGNNGGASSSANGSSSGNAGGNTGGDGGGDGDDGGGSSTISGNTSGNIGGSVPGGFLDELSRLVETIKNGDLTLPGVDPALEDPANTEPSAEEKIDQAAVAQSHAIRLPALPWTAIANDGLISELIGSFFAWDAPLGLPFIDRDSFLEDMYAVDPDPSRGGCCSRLLVNAMCALRSHTCPRAVDLGAFRGYDLSIRFFNESKRLLDAERGRVSLPTVWALIIMYTCCVARGQDRAGKMYYLAAFDMLRRLDLPRALERAERNDLQADIVRTRRVLTRALWGIYAFAGFTSSAYLLPNPMPRPTTPLNVLILGSPMGSIPQPTDLTNDGPLAPTLLDAACGLVGVMHDTAVHNDEAWRQGRVGRAQDMEARRRLCQRVREWTGNLPLGLTPEHRLSSATVFLAVQAVQAILAIYRPVHPDTPIPFFAAMALDSTAGAICVSACERAVYDLENLTRLLQMNSTGYSLLILQGLYDVAITTAGLYGRARCATSDDDAAVGGHQQMVLNEEQEGYGEKGPDGDGSSPHSDHTVTGAHSDVPMQHASWSTRGSLAKQCSALSALLTRACRLLAGLAGGYALAGTILRGVRAVLAVNGVELGGEADADLQACFVEAALATKRRRGSSSLVYSLRAVAQAAAAATERDASRDHDAEKGKGRASGVGGGPGSASDDEDEADVAALDGTFDDPGNSSGPYDVPCSFVVPFAVLGRGADPGDREQFAQRLGVEHELGVEEGGVQLGTLIMWAEAWKRSL